MGPKESVERVRKDPKSIKSSLQGFKGPPIKPIDTSGVHGSFYWLALGDNGTKKVKKPCARKSWHISLFSGHANSMSELVGRSSTTPTPSPSLVQSSFSSAAGNNITQTVCYLFPEVIIKHGKSKVISQNTLKTVFKKKQSDQIKTGGEQIYFAPTTLADHLSNFFVCNLFCKNGTIFLENKTKNILIGTI